MNREERKEAIDIIRKEYLCVDRDCDIERNCGKCDLMMPSKEPILEAYKMAIKALEQETKTGHWIEKDGFDGDTYYDCSECGESWTTIYGTAWDNGMKYCPNCGCRMVEPQEESGE